MAVPSVKDDIKEDISKTHAGIGIGLEVDNKVGVVSI